MLLVQSVAIFATMLCMFKNLPLIIIGRFFQGAISVVASLIMGKSISEHVPESMAGQYGMLTNIFINLGCLVSYSCGVLLSDDESTFSSDESWKLVTAMPAFVGFISVVLTLVFFPDEPIGWCIANDRIADAKRGILSVYAVRVKPG